MESWFRHLLTPHQTNNHRARVLHPDVLLFYVILVTVLRLGFIWGHREYPQVLGYATDIHTDKLLSATNAKRQASGLPPLQINPSLSQAAAEKARDMFSKNYWAHNSPDGRTPWDFIVESGYRYTVAGENLAKNFSNSDGVVSAWMASSSHRDNILKPGYRDIGFAVVNGILAGEETTLVIQLFGATASLAVAPPASPMQRDLTAKQTFGVFDQRLLPKESPIVISEVASSIEKNTIGKGPGMSDFVAVIRNPKIDVRTASRQFVYIFVGFLLGVLLVDAWLVKKRRIVRAAGHNMAHLLFLGSILLAIAAMTPGNIL